MQGLRGSLSRFETGVVGLLKLTCEYSQNLLSGVDGRAVSGLIIAKSLVLEMCGW